MAEIVGNCPRCGAQRITFDAMSAVKTHTEYDWKRYYECFCKCRNCSTTTIFVISQSNYEDNGYLAKHSPVEISGSLNPHFSIEGIINAKDRAAAAPPEHVPEPIAKVFSEGAACMVVQCWNAAGAMFRLCVDLATEPLTPKDEQPGLTAHIRKNLGPRMEWLIKNGLLPKELTSLSDCIREDGNDAAHRAALKKEDAMDLQDFTEALLERMFTEPERLRLAEKRRADRRSTPNPKS